MLRRSAENHGTLAAAGDAPMANAAIQGELWGARARDWVEVNEPAWEPVFETALKQAGVSLGKRLLDVGCGSGGALVLARAMGAEVAGIDASASLAEIARKRLPGAEIEVGDMEDLPFGDEAFDVVTGINSFQFAADIVRALSEARRVLHRGGTLLMLVWGKREDCELIAGSARAVFALLPPSRPGAPPPRNLDDPDAIEALMRDARLTPTGRGEFSASLAFPDAKAALLAMLAASERAIRHVGEETVVKAVLATLPPFTRPDGTVVWNNRFRWVAATRS
jgi:SAM-dependent methyltransferase